jgi:hypothetical protein
MMDAYAALGQHRSTQRKVPRGGEDEESQRHVTREPKKSGSSEKIISTDKRALLWTYCK